MDKGIRAQPMNQPMRERDQNSLAFQLLKVWESLLSGTMHFFQNTVKSLIVNYFM